MKFYTAISMVAATFLGFVIHSSVTSSSKTIFSLTSSSFANNELIPLKFTGDGENISPELHWTNAPIETKSFALIVEDPDAGDKPWVHWLIFNIPSNTRQLPQGVEHGFFISGETNFYYTRNGVFVYGGPYPPSGQTHHYHFILYALDTLLDLPADTARDAILKAMEGHILGKSTLIGVYEHHNKP